MSSIIQSGYGVGAHAVPPGIRETKRGGTRRGGFLDIAAGIGRGASGAPEAARETAASSVDAYMEHLEKKYGRVTVESVGKDRESLEKAGKRMSGRDVVIAPNILEDMANDPKTAVCFEQKIDYFFNTVIPQGNAICAAKGLVFEPCGVVVHEDGSVTYICGCSDSPERVAEVNRINAEKAKKKAARQELYLEQSAAAAAQRRAMWERAAETEAREKTYSSIGGLLKTRAAPAAEVPPEAFLPAGTNLFYIDL